jgi:hypothetical protein
MTKVADTQYRGLAGMGGRASLTTNAWDPSEQSVAQREFESSATDIYRQFKRPPANLSFTNKRERRKILQIVYGEALREKGGHVDIDAIEAEAVDLLERDPAQARRFYGNEIVHGHGSWLPDGLWDGTEAPHLARGGMPVCGGFDGSDVDDHTAIRLETLDGYQFTPTYPAGGELRPTIWNPAEWGGRIPRSEVHAAVDHIFRTYRVLRFYGDPPGWQSEIEAWGLEHGEDVVIEWATYRGGADARRARADRHGPDDEGADPRRVPDHGAACGERPEAGEAGRPVHPRQAQPVPEDRRGGDVGAVP